MSKAVVDKVNKWIETESRNFDQETDLKNAHSFLNSSHNQVESKTIQYTRNSVAEGTKFKEQGNKQFENQQFDEAIKSYTSAISMDPNNAIYYANRAMALIKLNKFKEALGDCDQALKLDPKYVKAYVRRASIYTKLSQFTEAYLDYSKALEFEPTNAQAKKELQVLTKGGKIDMKAVENAKNAKPATTPVSKEQPKPQTQNTQNTQTQTKPTQSAQPKSTSTTTTTTTSTTKPSSVPQTQTQSIQNKTQKSVQNKEVLEPATKPKEAVKPVVQYKREDDRTSANTQAKKKLKVTEVSKLEMEMESLRKLKKSVPTTPPSKFPEFEQIWTSLHEFSDRSQYFKIIQPSNYESIFGESLESEIFDEFIKILLQYLYVKKRNNEILKEILNVKERDNERKEDKKFQKNKIRDLLLSRKEEGENSKNFVTESLRNLANLRRFSLLAMFMSSEIKKVLNEIFEIIGNENGLKQKYL